METYKDIVDNLKWLLKTKIQECCVNSCSYDRKDYIEGEKRAYTNILQSLENMLNEKCQVGQDVKK